MTNHGIVCPHCNSVAHKHDEIFHKKRNVWMPRYICKSCRKTFNRSLLSLDVCVTCHQVIKQPT